MKETMQAAVFESEGKLTLMEIPVPQITKADEVLIKIEAASICGTDVHVLSVPQSHPGKIGVVLGHEYIGEIVEKGAEVTNLKKGDRVAVDPNIPCGVCYYCKRGMPNMCPNIYNTGLDVNGGFAQYVVVPASACAKISKKIPTEVAIFAEPMVCVVSAMQKIGFNVGETALVLGAGPIGLYFIQMLKAAGAKKIIASEVSAYRTKYAYESGADIVVDPTKDDLKAVVQRETAYGVDVTIDAVGTLIADAIENTRAEGRIMLFGMNTLKTEVINQSQITRKNLTILSNYINAYKFTTMIDILESGLLPLQKLVTHKLPLSRIHEGLDAMRRGEALEVIVYPWDDAEKRNKKEADR